MHFVWILHPEDSESSRPLIQPHPMLIQVPYGKFMRDPAVWAVITAHFCFNWGYYTLLSWLPSYFDLALGLKVDKSSIFTLIPYLAMVLMTPFVGPTADGLIANGMSVTKVRKLCQGLSFVGPAICMAVLAVLTPISAAAAATGTVAPVMMWSIVGLLSVAFALSAWARAGLYCNHQDMSPKYAFTTFLSLFATPQLLCKCLCCAFSLSGLWDDGICGCAGMHQRCLESAIHSGLFQGSLGWR